MEYERFNTYGPFSISLSCIRSAKAARRIFAEIDSLMYSLIWSGNPFKINRHTIIGDYNKDGLNMLHLPQVQLLKD